MEDIIEKEMREIREVPEEEMPLWKTILLLVIGAACIAVGARLLVDNGTLIAQGLGVPESVIPRECGVNRWIDQLDSLGLYGVQGEYEPKPGDLVFYNLYGDRNADHMGIVAEVGEGWTSAIEGNAQDDVQLVRRYDSVILGYGIVPAGYADLSAETVGQEEVTTEAQAASVIAEAESAESVVLPEEEPVAEEEPAAVPAETAPEPVSGKNRVQKLLPEKEPASPPTEEARETEGWIVRGSAGSKGGTSGFPNK